MDIAKEILRESGEKCGYGGQSIIICSYPNSGHFKYIKNRRKMIRVGVMCVRPPIPVKTFVHIETKDKSISLQ